MKIFGIGDQMIDLVLIKEVRVNVDTLTHCRGLM